MPQSERPKKLKWPGMLPMEDNQVNEDHSKEVKVDFPLATGNLMQSLRKELQEEDNQYTV